MPVFKRGRLDAKDIRRDLSDPRMLCEALGFSEKSKPQPNGGLLIKCPAHVEKTPSCSVTVGPDGTVRACCFGCGFTGDALHLVALARGLDIRRDFRAVLFEAANISRNPGVKVPPLPPRLVKVKEKPSPEKVDAILRAFLEGCPLTMDVQVCNYLVMRPSGSALFSEAKRAGWGALPGLKASQKLAKKLLSSFGEDGLSIAGFALGPTGPVPVNSFHRLLIPFYAPDGRLQTIQRRRLNDKPPKYLFPRGNGALWPYGLEAISQIGPTTSVVYVEGAIDTLERRAKYRALGEDRLVLGIPGVASWRPEWAEFAKDREVRIALDADGAGEDVVPKLTMDLWKAGALKIHRTRPADGRKDWNSPSSKDKSVKRMEPHDDR